MTVNEETTSVPLELFLAPEDQSQTRPLYSSSDCNFNASRLGVFCFALAEAAALRQYESGNSMRDDDLRTKQLTNMLRRRFFLISGIHRESTDDEAISYLSYWRCAYCLLRALDHRI